MNLKGWEPLVSFFIQELFYFIILKYNSLSLKLCTIYYSKVTIGALFMHYKHTTNVHNFFEIFVRKLYKFGIIHDLINLYKYFT